MTHALETGWLHAEPDAHDDIIINMPKALISSTSGKVLHSVVSLLDNGLEADAGRAMEKLTEGVRAYQQPYKA